MLSTDLIQCPYCWQMIEVVIDPSEPEQDYIEDCSVCCQPIRLIVTLDEEQNSNVSAMREDE